MLLTQSVFNQFIKYYQINGIYVLQQFIRHFLISIYGVLFAAILAIPLGIFISSRYKLSKTLIGIANVIQTIPSLAMMTILMIGMGLGTKTVIMTVALYSFLPILKNTTAGINSVPDSLLYVARGMGMTRWQRIIKVELPLSISVIIAGIRNALIVAIGITTIGTFIGAGGLGDIITRGINVADGSAIILAGAIPTAFMAILIDLLLGRIETILTPQNGLITK